MSRDGVTGPWWISFEAMLTKEQLNRIGLSKDRGSVLCTTRLCAALTEAEEERERLLALLISKGLLP